MNISIRGSKMKRSVNFNPGTEMVMGVVVASKIRNLIYQNV